jgi:hypothetical protein
MASTPTLADVAAAVVKTGVAMILAGPVGAAGAAAAAAILWGIQPLQAWSDERSTAQALTEAVSSWAQGAGITGTANGWAGVWTWAPDLDLVVAALAVILALTAVLRLSLSSGPAMARAQRANRHRGTVSLPTKEL